ncbi:MAG: ABC transporter ATP-binding protein [Clostridia bacterium]|nr:ABC transporter ATP-binding protein [Clostridia bacterium]
MSDTILEIKNVSKYYGKTKVVDNVTFEVKKGEIFGFLGPNGAGKTTTIKMILGLISIDEGSIKVNGYDIKKDFEKAMEYIGGIVENPDMYAYMSAVDNLKLFAKIRNINYSEVYKSLELVGLQKSMNQKISKYSLGMKQRAGLALSLLHSPKILILDEPTNGLDPVGIKELRDILKKLAKEKDTAILVSSHILSEMELMCDKVAVIDKGKIVKVESLTQNENDNENSTKAVQCVIKVKQQEKAVNILKEKLNKIATIKDEKIYVTANKGEISSIVKTLAINDIDVEYANENEHTLEDLFFDVTKGDKKDE